MVCRGPCGERKPIEEFHRRGKGLDHRYYQCKKCWATRTEKWRKENPDKFAVAHEKRRLDGRRKRYRLTYLLRGFGLNLEWYDRQMTKQKGNCASCGDHLDELNPSGKPSKERWHTMPCIHHSHSYGHVVDILCNACNMAEGCVRTPERAHKLWRYMQRDALFYSANKTPDIGPAPDDQ
jgi:hypothetical protein